MLDYKLVHALAMVVQAGGFDRAAAVLHITQSAVSQRVRLLEEQTGRILLARTTPPRPTAAGKRLIKHYRLVEQLEAELNETVDAVGEHGYRTLSIGINADSLATWFLAAVTPLLKSARMVLDIQVDDQDETHRLLRDGEVAGCISTRAVPAQGCRVIPLGEMPYRLYAAPAFICRHFPDGLTHGAVGKAPALIFNRKDRLLHRFLDEYLGGIDDGFPRHYLPSSEAFVEAIAAGIAYGVLPDLQALPLAEDGRLVDLFPGCAVYVALYWHCWGVAARPLRRLTDALAAGAAGLLGRPGAAPPKRASGAP
jgi:LysR family transcriptional regulator, chromosome initiation inhibitor